MKQTIEFKAKLVREPISSSKTINADIDWRETSYQWLITINNQTFDFYTGKGLVNRNQTPKIPTLDDVLECLIRDSTASEQSFDDWCYDYGYSTDSRSALEAYLACQNNAQKLRKANIDIQAEANRLFN